MFVFASFTGISYIDLKNFTWKEIITEEDGSLWIYKSRQKTGIPFNVKLLNIPIQIIDRYKCLSKDGLIFNIYCQVKINKLLKEVAKICGIIRPLSFHVSRHVFASQVCLSQGVPIKSVSKMLGHTDISTTQRYAHVNREKIGNDMKLLSMRLKNKFNYPIF
jgi:integrase